MSCVTVLNSVFGIFLIKYVIQWEFLFVNEMIVNHICAERGCHILYVPACSGVFLMAP
jgi:hypothetical protein